MKLDASMLVKWFLCLAFLFLPFRVYHLMYPLLDSFTFRQTQTATVTKNFYQYGIDFFATQLDIAGTGKEKYLLLEFPLYQAAVTTLYRLFSFSELWGRVVSIVAGLVGAWFLFRIVLFVTKNLHISLLSVFFFLGVPLSLFYHRSFMIDPTIIAFLLAGTYVALCWVETGGKRKLLIATVLLSLGFLQKGLYGPFWLFPLTWYYYKTRWHVSEIPHNTKQFIFLLSVPMLILLLWQQYENQFNIDHGHAFFTTSASAHIEWNFGLISDRWNISIWNQLSKQLLNGLLLKPGILFFFLGIISLRRYDRYGFLRVFLLSQIIYFLVVFRIQLQNYYQLVMVAGISVPMAVGLKTLRHPILISIFASFFLWRSWISALPSFFIDWEWLSRIQSIAEVTEDRQAGIFAVPGNNWNSVYTYYSRRIMKQTGIETVTEEQLDEWKRQGYTFLVLHEREKYTDYLSRVKPGHSLEFLSRYPVLTANQEFLIYKL